MESNSFEAIFDDFLQDHKQVTEAFEIARIKFEQDEGEQVYLQVSGGDQRVYTTIFPPSWFFDEHLVYLLVPPPVSGEDLATRTYWEQLTIDTWKEEIAKAQAIGVGAWNRTMSNQYPLSRDDVSSISLELADLYDRATAVDITLLGRKDNERWYDVNFGDSETSCPKERLLEVVRDYLRQAERQ